MVRTRSDEKRREIIRVAAKAFEELGYERTSMLTIAERMRGSKQTLYNYFPSKEDLLRAVLDFDVGEVADQAMQEFLARKEPAQGADATRGNLPRTASSPPWRCRTFESSPPSRPSPASVRTSTRISCASAWKRVADAFKALMAEGKLRRADPWLAAMHWKGLVLLRTCSNGSSSARLNRPDPQEIEAAAKRAADAFLKIYGPDDPAPKARRRS